VAIEVNRPYLFADVSGADRAAIEFSTLPGRFSKLRTASSAINLQLEITAESLSRNFLPF
jgi:hypothetical protein